jgi:hypothetical protein
MQAINFATAAGAISLLVMSLWPGFAGGSSYLVILALVALLGIVWLVIASRSRCTIPQQDHMLARTAYGDNGVVRSSASELIPSSFECKSIVSLFAPDAAARTDIFAPCVWNLEPSTTWRNFTLDRDIVGLEPARSGVSGTSHSI